MDKTVREVLIQEGIPFRSGGADWFRIPAVWRGSEDYNLSVNRNTGSWVLHSTGEHGNWADLVDRLGIGNDKRVGPLRKDPIPFRRDSKKAAKELWDNAFPLRYPEEYRQPFPALKKWRDAAWAYLENRGIPQAAVLTYAPDIRVYEDNDAVLLLIPLRAPVDGDPLMGVQRIRIDASGHKAPFLDKKGKPTEAKRMLGPRKTETGATGWWLPESPKGVSHPDRVLLCEGPETAMGLQAFTGRQVWCLADAGGLQNASSSYLEKRGIRSVCIAGDNDSNQVGLIAAADLALRLRTEHPDWRVTVALPSERDTDWLDLLMKYGPEQARLKFSQSLESF